MTEVRAIVWSALDAEHHYAEEQDSGAEPFEPTDHPFVLVEKATLGGRYWLTGFSSPQEAADYHDEQEDPGNWEVVALYNLDSGMRFQAVTRTTFIPHQETT